MLFRSVDGYCGFLFLDRYGNLKVSHHIQTEIRFALKRYAKLYPDKPLPNISPHVLRHTFCTNMANAGMDVKNLQYIMGHSNVNVTLNVYTHTTYDRVAEQMAEIVDFKSISKRADYEQLGFV